jgi:hypothetical protein
VAILVMIALLVLSATQSFQCTSKTGLKVECRLCGTPIPLVPGQDARNNLTYFTNHTDVVIGGDVYQCDGLKDAFNIALSGYY